MFKKINYNSPVVLTFSLISFISLILGHLTNGESTKMFFMIFPSSLTDPLLYLRLFTHVIGHADLNHFVSNFLIILLVGPMLEEKYGSKNLLVMIIITALITGLINIIFFSNALLGASGVVFMMILLSSFTNLDSGKIPFTFILVVILFLGKEIISGLFTKDNISQFAHIIGGICGGVFGFSISKFKKL